MIRILMLWLAALSAVYFVTEVDEVSGYVHKEYHGHDYHYYDDHHYDGHYDYDDAHHDYYNGHNHEYDYGHDYDHDHHSTPEKTFCSLHPCKNNGTCVENGYKAFCECTCDYQGKFCHIKKDPCESKPCQNGGTCMPKIENGTCSYTCACSCDRQGPNCTQDQDLCEPNPCQNGGKCTPKAVNGTCSYKCQCGCDRQGPNCTQDICEPNLCREGLICVPVCKYKCACPCDRAQVGENCNLTGVISCRNACPLTDNQIDMILNMTEITTRDRLKAHTLTFTNLLSNPIILPGCKDVCDAFKLFAAVYLVSSPRSQRALLYAHLGRWNMARSILNTSFSDTNTAEEMWRLFNDMQKECTGVTPWVVDDEEMRRLAEQAKNQTMPKGMMMMT